MVLLVDGFWAAVAFWSAVVAAPAADCDPLPTVLDGVWLLTGGLLAALLLVCELCAEAAL